MTKEISIWENEQRLMDVRNYLRNTFGANLSDPEFTSLVEIGKATKLNPFMREIWAVKYGTQQASIFIGRDGYRRSAQSDKDYEFHTVDAVYSNDTFEVDPAKGEVMHKYNLKDRGTILGAYCLVKRKRSKIAAFNYVEFKEYYQGNKDENGKVKMKKGYQGKPDYAMKETVWDTKPATMIKKVAEAQGLRGSFQGLFAGTYEESENWRQDEPKPEQPNNQNVSDTKKNDSNTDKKPNDTVKHDNVIDAEVVDTPKDEPTQVVVQQHDGYSAIVHKPAGEPLAANERPIGTPGEDESKCMQCERIFKGDAPFCPKCTAALEQDANDAGVTTQQQPVTPPSSTLKLPIKRKDGEINMTEHTRKKMYAVWSQYFKLAIEKKAIKDDTDSTDLRREKMKKLFAVESSKDLGDEQAKLFIERIEKEIVRLGGTLHTAEVAPPPESPTPVYSEAEYAADEQAGMELM